MNVEEKGLGDRKTVNRLAWLYLRKISVISVISGKVLAFEGHNHPPTSGILEDWRAP